jgi:hypothetical protein
MNVTLSKKLRFSDAVYAIGTTPKALRLWLQRGSVTLFSPVPEDGGWAEYTFVDIGILALVRKLADFGIPVATASEIANNVVFYYFPIGVSRPENVPAAVLALGWKNRRLHIYREGEEWKTAVVTLWMSSLDSDANGGFDPNLPSSVALLRAEIEQAPVFLSVDVETILRTAFARAIESLTEGGEAE